MAENPVSHLLNFGRCALDERRVLAYRIEFEEGRPITAATIYFDAGTKVEEIKIENEAAKRVGKLFKDKTREPEWLLLKRLAIRANAIALIKIQKPSSKVLMSFGKECSLYALNTVSPEETDELTAKIPSPLPVQ